MALLKRFMQPVYYGVNLQLAIDYSISMVVGGLFYVRKIRSLEATTMIDPIQNVFGQVMGALLVRVEHFAIFEKKIVFEIIFKDMFRLWSIVYEKTVDL